MAVWKTTGQMVVYYASAVNILIIPLKTKKTARITTLRSERGYSVTNYNTSPVRLPEPIRCQIGSSYDVKTVRNISSNPCEKHPNQGF
jgi:hypothetical protein